MPYFVLFRPRSKREADGIDGKQDLDVRVGFQVFFPSVPFVGRSLECASKPFCGRMLCIFYFEDSGGWPPGVAFVLSADPGIDRGTNPSFAGMPTVLMRMRQSGTRSSHRHSPYIFGMQSAVPVFPDVCRGKARPDTATGTPHSGCPS